MKTNTDNIAKPAVSLILLGVLKGYIKNPIGFIIKSKQRFEQYVCYKHYNRQRRNNMHSVVNI